MAEAEEAEAEAIWQEVVAEALRETAEEAAEAEAKRQKYEVRVCLGLKVSSEGGITLQPRLSHAVQALLPPRRLPTPPPAKPVAAAPPAAEKSTKAAPSKKAQKGGKKDVKKGGSKEQAPPKPPPGPPNPFAYLAAIASEPSAQPGLALRPGLPIHFAETVVQRAPSLSTDGPSVQMR